MMANSVDDGTAQAIAAGMGCDNTDALNGVCNQLLRYLPRAENGGEMALANAVWHDVSVSVLDSYRLLMGNVFGSDVMAVDFGRPDAVSGINGWCREKTGGKIDRIINTVPDGGLVMWANALYFSGVWDEPFDKQMTRQMIFHGRTGDVGVEMMHRDYQTEYACSDMYETVSVYFKGQTTALNLYLPRPGVACADMLASIGGDEECHVANVHLDVPKFSVETSHNMTEVLKGLGINLDNVGLRPMGIQATGSIQFMHKTSTSIDEDGATAAAVSYGHWDILPIPEELAEVVLKFDRPFVYTITNRISNSCIMAGYVADPTR